MTPAPQCRLGTSPCAPQGTASSAQRGHRVGGLCLALAGAVLPSSWQFKSTPDLLRDQREVAQPGSSEHTKELIYSILKEG